MLSDNDVQTLLGIALAGCHRGQVIQARAVCDAVLVVKPGFVPACITLAFSHIVADEFAHAESILREVLAVSPDDQDALLMLGLAQGLQGDTAQARQSLNALSAHNKQATAATANAGEAPCVQLAKALQAHWS